LDSPDPKRVFIVYGRNAKAYSAMQLFLQSLKLDPLTFDEVRNGLGGSPFVGNVVDEGMRRAKAIVVLFTPDEYASLRPSLASGKDKPEELMRWQGRPNVLLEAGMALAIEEERTVLVVLGDVSLASDLHGRHYIRVANDPASRAALRNALIGIGCSVDQAVTSWHDISVSGDFEACVSSAELPEIDVQSPFPSPAKGGLSAADVKLQATSLAGRRDDLGYKAKLNVIFTNESDQTIEILRPRWLSDFDDVGVQSPLRHAYKLESSRGDWKRDSWGVEIPSVRVDPGWSFTLWIGLDPSMNHEELERRRKTTRLGTLIVPVKTVGGEQTDIPYRV
jgi:hypothetical protein